MIRASVRFRCLRIPVAALLCLVFGAAAAQSATDSAARRDNAAEDPWALSALYTHSVLGSDRGDWQQLDLDLYYRVSPRWLLSASADTRRRVDLTDVVYAVRADFYLTPAWQWHASLAATPDAEFTYERGYVLGTAWRATPWLSLLLETRGYEFPVGDLREWRPGATLWLNDDTTALTVGYTHGDAFNMAGYHAWSLRLDQGLGEGRRLSLGYVRGIDPERDPAVPGVLLSQASFYSAYYHFPLRATRPGLHMILGAEYEDRRDAYTRTGVSVGLVARF